MPLESISILRARAKIARRASRDPLKPESKVKAKRAEAARKRQEEEAIEGAQQRGQTEKQIQKAKKLGTRASRKTDARMVAAARTKRRVEKKVAKPSKPSKGRKRRAPTRRREAIMATRLKWFKREKEQNGNLDASAD